MQSLIRPVRNVPAALVANLALAIRTRDISTLLQLPNSDERMDVLEDESCQLKTVAPLL
jgi:hypothetical protein